MMRKLCALMGVLACLATTPARAEIEVRDLTQGVSPDALVNRLLGGGVTVDNITYTGATNAAGVFCTGEDAVGFENGIVLSSGSIVNVLPPNDASGAGTDNEGDGDPDLDALIPGFSTFDATVLEFDFVAEGDTVQFNYVFASEEYNEFVDSSFNDVFGFFVNGVNYALIPGTATAVAINNVNNGYAPASQPATGPCMNCEFYVDNVGTNASRQTQLDGLTTVLTFTAPVIAGQTNHLKIAIADAGDGILDSDVFIQAGSLRSGSSTNCVTRDARFWFTHPSSDNPECITLERALAVAINTGCNGMDLGFMEIPIGYRDDDNDRDEVDAAIEALGFYYRSQSRTGEIGGTQNQGRKGSKLCRERKRLTVEYIAAVANNLLLQTEPGNCSIIEKGGVAVAFPTNLLAQARSVLAGYNLDAVRAMTTTLRAFNSSGVTNPLPPTLLECSPTVAKPDLRNLSRDATTSDTCPGINESCRSAEVISFSGIIDPLAQPKFKARVDLSKYFNTTLSAPCAQGGRDAVWVILPDVGVAARRFTADTFGSNFDTVISVIRGDCRDGNYVACNDDHSELVDGGGIATIPQSKVSFTTDGTNTYYIVVEGVNDSYGKARLTVTSP